MDVIVPEIVEILELVLLVMLALLMTGALLLGTELLKADVKGMEDAEVEFDAVT